MTDGRERPAVTAAPRQGAAVLHVTSAAGGGVDRYIRDLAANSARPHMIWHVGLHVDVIEHPLGHYLPLHNPRAAAAGTALASWLRAAGAGIVHLHGVSEECRARTALVDRTLGLPCVVTLHDVGFVNPRAFAAARMPEPDPAWIAGVDATLRRAATVVAPSTFIRDIARRTFPGLPVEIIAPGVGPAPRGPVSAVAADFTAVAPRHIVAVVGAIGPHKGSGILDALATALTGTDVGLVVIGYTDTQLARGWARPGRYYVHGPYVDGTLAGWLAAYGASVVLFPNRLPESFSYTLSEVWAAGIPVVVPDEGALGDRVAEHGGGWRLPAGFGAPEAASLLMRILSVAGAGEYARVKLPLAAVDSARTPPLDAMADAFDALYARYALPPPDLATTGPARAEALAPLLAANLDGFTFRQELVRLAEELANTAEAKSGSALWVAKLEREIVDARAWAAKLERDIADVQSWTTKLERDTAQMQTWTGKLERQLVDSQDWAARLEAQLAASQDWAARLDRQLVDSQNWAAKLARDVEDTQAAAHLLQRGLDDSQARAALLERQLAESRAAGVVLEQSVASLERVVTESQAWAASLDAEVARSRAWAAKLEGDVAELERGVVGLEKGLGASQAWAGKLEGDVATLNAELARRVDETRRLADDKAAFDLLPELFRKFLLKRVFRARR